MKQSGVADSFLPNQTIVGRETVWCSRCTRLVPPELQLVPVAQVSIVLYCRQYCLNIRISLPHFTPDERSRSHTRANKCETSLDQRVVICYIIEETTRSDCLDLQVTLTTQFGPSRPLDLCQVPPSFNYEGNSRLLQTKYKEEYLGSHYHRISTFL